MFEDHPEVVILHRWLEDSASNETVPPNDSVVVSGTLQVYGVMYVAMFILFCILRRLFPRIYNVRSWAPGLYIDLARNSYPGIDWVWKVWLIPDDEFRDQCGMDALCFTRIVRFGLRIAMVGVFNSIWLMPVYATSKSSDETAHITDHLAITNVGHVPPGSLRFLGTVFAAYITFGSVMYMLLKEFEWFTEQRHLFLSAKKPRNYTIYVNHIPYEYRSSQKLLEYFRGCYSHEAVLEAHVTLNIPNLEAKIAEREGVIGNLEHAVNVEDVTGKKPSHRNILQGGAKVDSIETYSLELKNLNNEVCEMITKIERNCLPMSFRRDLESKGGSVVMSRRGVDGNSVGPNDASVSLSREQDSLATGQDNSTDSHFGKRMLSSVKSSASNAGGLAVSLLGGKEDGEAREAGFVSFTSLSTAQAATQMIHHPTPFSMDVSEAPDPDDIYWANVGKSHEVLQLGSLASLGLTAALCVFWTIPVTFIVTLTNVDSLKRIIPFLEDWIEDYPWIGGVLAQLAPVMLIVLNALLPIILGIFCKLEGPVSSSVLEASLFVKLSAFMIIQTFFVSTISGTLTQELANFIEEPTMIVDFLAASLPTQSTYFLQILMVRTFLGQGLELLRVVPVAIAAVRSRLGPNLTEKESNTAWMGLRPLADPGDFGYADVTSNLILYFMVLLVYSTMAPISNIIMSFCFVLLVSGYRHQLVYIYPSTPDSGGQLWIGFVSIVQTCMLIAEITLTGFLALKRATVATPFMFPLLIVTVLFNFYVRQRHIRVSQRLPSKNCIQRDRKNQFAGMDFDFLKKQYLQPALQSKEDAFPENLGVAREIEHQDLRFLTPPTSQAEILVDEEPILEKTGNSGLYRLDEGLYKHP